MAFDGRRNIIEINEQERTVYFETWKNKKITGAKIGAMLGYSEHTTPFKVACELAGLYPGDRPNKYIDAGNTLEPVLRNYLGRSATAMLGERLGVPEGTQLAVEMPSPKDMCGYDHFHDNRRFGGMVDGYIMAGGRRHSVLEIKTSRGKDRWTGPDGKISEVPMSYMLQASLYAELSRIDSVVFLVGFLQEDDYDRPAFWRPREDNTAIIVKEKLDMSGYMKDAEDWYREYILSGMTPEWTDADAELLKYLKAGVKW